jgi:hypothetical protein
VLAHVPATISPCRVLTGSAMVMLTEADKNKEFEERKLDKGAFL